MSAVLQDASRRQFLKTTVVVSGGFLGSGLIVGCASTAGPSTSAKLREPAIENSIGGQVALKNVGGKVRQAPRRRKPANVGDELDAVIDEHMTKRRGGARRVTNRPDVDCC